MGQKMLSYGCHTAFFFYLCHFMIQCLQHIRWWLDGHYGASVTVAVVLLALWQAVIALFGVDLCDTGYYLTFYDNIFKAPSSVEYNFMYYLSGVAGGALNAALPETGKWLAMRLAGVMCNVGVMALLAWALRRVLPATAVIGGFLMVVASLVAFPYTFNNARALASLAVGGSAGRHKCLHADSQCAGSGSCGHAVTGPCA